MGERSTPSHGQGALKKVDELRFLPTRRERVTSSPRRQPRCRRGVISKLSLREDWRAARFTCTTERSTEVSDTHFNAVAQGKKKKKYMRLKTSEWFLKEGQLYDKRAN